MKKKGTFLFLSTIIIICLFAVAASCNLCGIPIEIGDTSDTNTTEKDISASTTKTTSKSDGDGQQIDQTSQIDQETTEGSETSEDVEETTSETDQQDTVEESMENIAEPTIITLNPVGNETGCVSADRSQVVIYYILTGHSEDGKHYRGYISFDISGLSPANIIDFAELKLLNSQIFEPRAQLRDFRIGTIEYGAGPLSASVVGLTGNPIASLPNTTKDVSLSNNKLISELQSAVNNGEIRFQITLYWSSPEAYVDFATHGNVYLKENVSLLVSYF